MPDRFKKKSETGQLGGGGGRSGGSGGGKGGSGGGGLSNTGGPLSNRGGTLDKPSKEPSLVSQDEIQGPFKKAREFARREPVLGIAAYDLGKGILGKIMKTRIPTLPTPRAIRVSAKS